MLELYQAYSDYRALMDLTEELLTGLVKKVCGAAAIQYGEHQIDFTRWERLSMREAVCRFWPAEAGPAPSVEQLAAKGTPRGLAERYNAWAQKRGKTPIESVSNLSDGELTGLLFESVAEDNLIQPTLVYGFPTDISPLSKCQPDDASLAERFELFIGGLEVGNAFSELNDPIEQERRFREQVAQGGAEAPKEVDVDYIRALSHAMPPAAGEGIGIDRLTMLLTDSHSIREVILFPLLRPEAPPRTQPPAPGEAK